MGKVAGKAAREKAASSREGLVHERAADRTQRVAANSSRPGRQAQAKEAKAAQSDLLETASGRAGAAAGNLASGTVEAALSATGYGLENLPEPPPPHAKR